MIVLGSVALGEGGFEVAEITVDIFHNFLFHNQKLLQPISCPSPQSNPFDLT